MIKTKFEIPNGAVFVVLGYKLDQNNKLECAENAFQ